eukprot:TRINITY_DN3305_c0_g1_i1.p1 TRINITY_DN3305_c0_g1~~TRINITY_DN3305_c0_g1_i1.p1  ORF type:complete len:569 (+),score=97.96 TRINITY_DN3305_c0_g1_i1:81-1787(+)
MTFRAPEAINSSSKASFLGGTERSLRIESNESLDLVEPLRPRRRSVDTSATNPSHSADGGFPNIADKVKLGNTAAAKASLSDGIFDFDALEMIEPSRMSRRQSLPGRIDDARRRILLMVNGSRGDCSPMISLGLSLRTRGYVVRLLVNVDAVPVCQAYSLEAIPVFANCKDVIKATGGFSANATAMSINKESGAAARAWLRDNPDAVQSVEGAMRAFKPDLVVFTCLTSGPAIRYELATGVPVVPAALGAGFDIELQSGLLMQPPRPLLWTVSSLVEQPDPAKMPSEARKELRQTGPWTLPVDASHPLTPELEAFLNRHHMPLVFTWGSMLAKGVPPAAMVTLVLRTVRTLGCHAVIVGGWAGLHEVGAQLAAGESSVLGTPDAEALSRVALERCVFVPEAPFDLLLPRCSVVVHHGGCGTTQACLLAGNTCVVTPIAHDQFHFADIVTRLGVGVGFAKHLSMVSAEDLTEAVQQASGDTLRAAVTALSASLRDEKGVLAAADCLHEFLSEKVASGKWYVEMIQSRAPKGKEEEEEEDDEDGLSDDEDESEEEEEEEEEVAANASSTL